MLYPAKPFFKYEGETESFSDNNNNNKNTKVIHHHWTSLIRHAKRVFCLKENDINVQKENT